MARQIGRDVEAKRREADAEFDRERWRALDGETNGMEHTENLLRARAAELRTQRSGPTYKPQPKPSDVLRGQWWQFQQRQPELVSSVYSDGLVYFGDDPSRSTHEVAMLTCSDWHYLGDGPEPAR